MSKLEFDLRICLLTGYVDWLRIVYQIISFKLFVEIILHLIVVFFYTRIIKKTKTLRDD